MPSDTTQPAVPRSDATQAAAPAAVPSDAVQAAEHVSAAGAGTIVPLDIGALAAALTPLVTASFLRAELGEAGRRYAAQHFRWDSIAKQIHTMYCTCLHFADSPEPTPDPLPL